MFSVRFYSNPGIAIYFQYKVFIFCVCSSLTLSLRRNVLVQRVPNWPGSSANMFINVSGKILQLISPTFARRNRNVENYTSFLYDCL